MTDRNPAAVVVDGFRIASRKYDSSRRILNRATEETMEDWSDARSSRAYERLKTCDGRLGEAYADADQKSESGEQHVQRHD
jgi:hypothetical protein